MPIRLHDIARPYSNDHICVTPQARFGFHQAKFQRSTDMLWAGYSAGIREWINAVAA